MSNQQRGSMDSVEGALEETWAQRFYREQIALLQGNRIDDLIDRHYQPDATLKPLDSEF